MTKNTFGQRQIQYSQWDIIPQNYFLSLCVRDSWDTIDITFLKVLI